jgi:hypothetical protein
MLVAVDYSYKTITTQRFSSLSRGSKGQHGHKTDILHILNLCLVGDGETAPQNLQSFVVQRSGISVCMAFKNRAQNVGLVHAII